MDCGTGAALGRQFAKDAMNMHGGVGLSGAGNPEQDALMNEMMMMNGSAPPPGGDWAQHFASQQHMAMQRQHNEAVMMHQQHHQQHQHHHQQRDMEEAFRASAGGPQVAGPSMMPPQFMGPMMMPGAGAFGGFMMAPQPQMMANTTYAAQRSAMVRPVEANNGVSATMSATATAQPQTSLTQGSDAAWVENLRNAEWGQSYENVPIFEAEGEPAMSMEEKIEKSEFYAFMDKIRNKELIIDEENGCVVAGPGPDPEVPEDTEYVKQWAEMEGLDMPPEMFHPQMAPGQQFNQNLNQMHMDPTSMLPGEESTGDTPQAAEEEFDDWAREYAEIQEKQQHEQNRTDYPFEPNNPYLYHDKPMEEGITMLQVNNLAEAALAFEAACQKEAKNVEAWRILGTTQAENEKDSLAIIALNHARMLDPANTAVHAALAVSHTNEHNTHAALQSLRAWLLSHPQYEHLGSVALAQPSEETMDPSSDDFFFAAPSEYHECRTLFAAAIEMNPNDADLHASLGVLHNLSHRFDAASADFRRAVELRPDNAELWNKLGATLANGNRPEEALAAYGRALDINPGYVRVMYNMAVAHSNMMEHHLAARQITRAIAVQEGGTKPQGEGTRQATRGMWDLLRMALNLMNRTDLVELSWQQEIGPFLKEFKLEEMML